MVKKRQISTERVECGVDIIAGYNHAETDFDQRGWNVGCGKQLRKGKVVFSFSSMAE